MANTSLFVPSTQLPSEALSAERCREKSEKKNAENRFDMETANFGNWFLALSLFSHGFFPCWFIYLEVKSRYTFISPNSANINTSAIEWWHLEKRRMFDSATVFWPTASLFISCVVVWMRFTINLQCMDCHLLSIFSLFIVATFCRATVAHK